MVHNESSSLKDAKSRLLKDKSFKIAYYYFRLSKWLSLGEKKFIDIPVAKQKSYMESLGEPQNDIDRSYKQYLCSQRIVPIVKRILFGSCSIIITPFILLIYIIKGFYTPKHESITALMENKGMNEVVPLVVQDKYLPKVDYWKLRASLSIRDFCFIWQILCRGWHEPYFILRTIVNVAYYSDMIRTYSPKAMIAFMEYSYSSSILTSFCHSYGVLHINCMHGEKIFDIRQSFFHFDECYVWHIHYKQLFIKLHAEPTQFRIAIPPSMKIDISKHKNKVFYADYKYYLQDYSRKELQSIIQSMQFATREGKNVMYRPHPRYSNIKILEELVPPQQIENVFDVSIIDSISNCGCAISRDSTILIQGYLAGIQVLIDDVTFKKNYMALKERDYILSTTLCAQRFSIKQ